MAAEEKNVPHVQAKFFTKQQQYSVDDSPFSVPATVTTSELSSLINGLLHTDGEDANQIHFNFLIDGEYLRTSLQSHMQNKEISTETVVEIEYVEHLAAPEPEDSLSHDDWVSAITAAGDYILTGSYDNTVRIWNTEGDMLVTIPGHGAPVKSLAWIKQDDEDPVHRFLSGSHDESVLMWEWNQQSNSIDCLHSCRGHAGSVDAVAVDPSKTKFCSGSWDRMLKIWSAVPNPEEDSTTDEEGKKPHKRKKTDGHKIPTRVPIMTLSGHGEGISASLWMSENEICTASWDHSIRLWDIEKTENTQTLNGTKVFLDIDYSVLNKTVIAASADRHVRLYDPRTSDGAVVKCTYTSHTAWVSSVSWSTFDEFQFLSGSYDNLVKLWDTRSPKAPLYDLSGHEEKVLSVDWSIPQYMLSGGADNQLKIFKYSDQIVYGRR